MPDSRTSGPGRWRHANSDLSERLVQAAVGPVLRGRRVMLRPLRPSDFLAWQEVRRRCRDWLVRWEPRRPASQVDPVESRRAFEARCEQRDRDRIAGTACGFGIFVGDRFVGELNLNNIVRGAAQNAYVGFKSDRLLESQHPLLGEAAIAESNGNGARLTHPRG